MTQNRRIFFNIVSTYGRSLYALALGLFTARWALQALGQVDYGLYGVMGGLTVFISFFNSLLGNSVGRFYAVAIGKASVSLDKVNALEECRGWFSTAVMIHLVVSIILVSVGYPVGIWAVRSFLTIPSDRISDCVIVFRLVCLSCFLMMVTVPVNAMYVAKQYIAELTIYSFVTTTLTAVVLYYMVTHSGVWLAKYAFCMCCLASLPQIIIAVRGLTLFEECRLKIRYCFSGQRIRELFYFVGWSSFGSLGSILRSQGVQILVNKYYGPTANASMSIANSINGHTMILSGAMIGAFQPAIVSACGAGDFNRMRCLAYRACKFSMLFILIFMLPLGLELKFVLKLWLINPPPYVCGLCMIVFVITLIDQSAVGHMLAVNAVGKIARYQAFLGSVLLLSLPLAWVACVCGFNIYYIGFALLVTMMVCAWGRTWFARSLVGLSVRYWGIKIMAPISVVTAVCICVGFLPHFFMRPSVLRLLLTVGICEFLLMTLAWFVLLDASERLVLTDVVRARFRHFRSRRSV